MDELLIYVRGLMTLDAYLLSQFAQAGASKVTVTTPDQSMVASYPKIILDGDEGDQHITGDNQAKIFDGRIRVEIVCKQSDACPNPQETLRLIQGQITDLLLGNKARQLPGVVEQKVGPMYRCTRFRQVKPTGYLPVVDKGVARHRTTYEIQLNRQGW